MSTIGFLLPLERLGLFLGFRNDRLLITSPVSQVKIRQTARTAISERRIVSRVLPKTRLLSFWPAEEAIWVNAMHQLLQDFLLLSTRFCPAPMPIYSALDEEQNSLREITCPLPVGARFSG